LESCRAEKVRVYCQTIIQKADFVVINILIENPRFFLNIYTDIKSREEECERKSSLNLGIPNKM
jgi:hypothetical protein